MIQNQPMSSIRTDETGTRKQKAKFNKKLWPIYSGLVEQVTSKLDAKDASTAIGCASISKHEGATTVAANLAIAYSMIFEQPVLFINATESDQRLGSLMGTVPKKGLNDLIDGEGDEVSDVIASTPFEGLDYLANGLKAKSFFSTRLLAKFPSLLDVLKIKYRMIVIDLPDLRTPSSSGPLAGGLEGVLLVVQPGKVKTQEAVKVKQHLQRSGVRLLGAVMNRHDS